MPILQKKVEYVPCFGFVWDDTYWLHIRVPSEGTAVAPVAAEKSLALEVNILSEVKGWVGTVSYLESDYAKSEQFASDKDKNCLKPLIGFCANNR